MYPFDAVVTCSFFVQSRICFDETIEEVKGFLALLGGYVTEITERIDGPRVCCRIWVMFSVEIRALPWDSSGFLPGNESGCARVHDFSTSHKIVRCLRLERYAAQNASIVCGYICVGLVKKSIEICLY